MLEDKVKLWLNWLVFSTVSERYHITKFACRLRGELFRVPSCHWILYLLKSITNGFSAEFCNENQSVVNKRRLVYLFFSKLNSLDSRNDAEFVTNTANGAITNLTGFQSSQSPLLKWFLADNYLLVKKEDFVTTS